MINFDFIIKIKIIIINIRELIKLFKGVKKFKSKAIKDAIITPCKLL